MSKTTNKEEIRAKYGNVTTYLFFTAWLSWHNSSIKWLLGFIYIINHIPLFIEI